MNIVFITAGPIQWASSRMRAYWVAEELRKRGHTVIVAPYSERKLAPAGDAWIWQKSVDIDMVADIDCPHFWDVCDPAWWWQPEVCAEIASVIDGVVASSGALAMDYNEWEPAGTSMAVTIPDCLDFTHFDMRRVHEEVEPVRLIWYGIAANRVALWGAKAMLERLVANSYRIELTIMDDRPDVRFAFSDAFPIYHTQWSLEREVEIISSHDIALLPPYPGPWGRVKSNNKRLTAVACGLPVVSDSYHVLEKLMDAKTRELYVLESLPVMQRAHDIAVAADKWEQLLGVRS